MVATTTTQPAKIAVTGAGGQIGYALLFRLATGAMLDKKRPVILHLLEIPAAEKALEGVAMELLDSAFPLLHGVVCSTRTEDVFKDADYAFLVGAKPRSPGMERSDLLAENAAIFREQGRCIDAVASPNIKVLVVGNPANTNALIAANNAPQLNPRQFTAMTRLDHNRALAQLSTKINSKVAAIKKMTIWGNHSSTQYPDISQTVARGKKIKTIVDFGWYENEFIPRVANRGAEVIQTRGASSAASAASAAIDHMHDWAMGTKKGDWTSMAIPSDGSYGIEPGIVFSFPVTCEDGEYSIVQDLPIDEFSQQKIDITEKELREEKDAIAHMLK